MGMAAMMPRTGEVGTERTRVAPPRPGVAHGNVTRVEHHTGHLAHVDTAAYRGPVDAEPWLYGELRRLDSDMLRRRLENEFEDHTPQAISAIIDVLRERGFTVTWVAVQSAPAAYVAARRLEADGQYTSRVGAILLVCASPLLWAAWKHVGGSFSAGMLATAVLIASRVAMGRRTESAGREAVARATRLDLQHPTRPVVTIAPPEDGDDDDVSHFREERERPMGDEPNR